MGKNYKGGNINNSSFDNNVNNKNIYKNNNIIVNKVNKINKMNYDPKLIKKTKINIDKDNVRGSITFNYNRNIRVGDTLDDPELSPLSGSEPIYDPHQWNDNPNIKGTHNCYSYVLNKIASSRAGKPQPGFYSGYPSLRDDEYSCHTFLKRLQKDIPSLVLTDFKTPCPKGSYKGFIAIDPKKDDPDYHFYRQDKNGYWSHKPGKSSAVNIDASKNPIKNPAKANRKYEHFNYNVPCFFFCINSKLARSSSTTHKSKWNY